MIKSFSDKETKNLWDGHFSKKIPPTIQRKALYKLEMLNNIIDVNELLIPPSNRLHKLSGDRKDQFAISINDQWRICFKFENSNVYDVEITDYH